MKYPIAANIVPSEGKLDECTADDHKEYGLAQAHEEVEEYVDMMYELCGVLNGTLRNGVVLLADTLYGLNIPTQIAAEIMAKNPTGCPRRCRNIYSFLR